jgi:hypothetical protein
MFVSFCGRPGELADQRHDGSPRRHARRQADRSVGVQFEPETLHLPQPPGAGGAGGPPQQHPDRPDVDRLEPRRLPQRARAGLLGVPVRQRDRRPLRERLQVDLAAAELARAVGLLVEERGEERPQALRRQTQFLEGSAPVPPQVELLQVRWLKTRRRVELFWGRFQFDGDQGFDFAFGCQFRLVSLDQAALRRVHVLSDRTPGRRSHGGRSYRRHPGRNREYCRL